MEFIDQDCIPGEVTNYKVPIKEVVIVPIGDVHLGSKQFAESSFMHYLEAVENEFGDRAYYLGMGDYIDATRTTVRKAVKALSPDDGEFVDELIDSHIEKLYNMLSHTTGRWLGLLGGNHTWDFRDGQTTETKLCGMLNAKYLGGCADIKVGLGENSVGGARSTFGIWCHHGFGGKYPVRRLINGIAPHFPDSDVWMVGHSHVREFRDFPRLRRLASGYSERNGICLVTGGWTAGYTQGPSTYVERAAMSPLANGSAVVKARLDREANHNNIRLRVETV
jgi:hypothetical protein